MDARWKNAARGAVLMATLVVAAGGCRPPSPPGAVTPPARPLMWFPVTSHDFGSMLETEERSARLEFVNTGGTPLVIKEVKTTCGCTAATLDRLEYAPGEAGSLDVVFDPTGPGEQVKHINVLHNGGVVQLEVTADVQAFITIEPPAVKLGVLPYGVEHRTTIEVSGPAEDFVVESMSSTNGSVRVRPAFAATRSARSGVHVLEIIVAAEAPWGGLFSQIGVTGRGRVAPGTEAVTHTSYIHLRGQLFGQLSGDPDAFRFGVKPGGSFTRTVRLRRPSGQPFRIVSESVECPALAAGRLEVEVASTASYDLTLHGTAGRAEGVIMGRVVIGTDVAGEETIELPIVGAVRTTPAGVR